MCIRDRCQRYIVCSHTATLKACFHFIRKDNDFFQCIIAVSYTHLCHAYDRGVRQVRGFQEVWDSVEPFVDARRFGEVQSKLKIQMRDAVWWKDACLLYFQTFSGMPIPAGIERPVHELEDMKRFRLEISNYECPESGFNK